MKIAVWYHCIISGGQTGVSPDYSLPVIQEQMQALQKSSLLANAAEFHVGVNGGTEDYLLASILAGDRAHMIPHGPAARTEIPTLKRLQAWLPGHEDWAVLYHHTKGVTHNADPLYEAWRRRMEKACVWGWLTCVSDLRNGCEAVGGHWLTPEQYPNLVASPFFGGTFWWATGKYLAQLPALPEATWENRYEAELWIGRRRPYPQIRNYIPGWP